MTTKIYPIIANNEDLEKINRFARRPLSEEEVYTFSLVLCDNEIDRDLERFTIPALEALAKLFVGETGIFDHALSGKNQTARVFAAETAADPERRTVAGEPYTFLKAKVYVLKNEQMAPLIAEINNGCERMVSIGCSIGRVICSICGGTEEECPHEKGNLYNGVVCHHILEDPNILYEWGLVVVPQTAVSQPKVKRMDESANRVKTDENFRVDTIQDAIEWFKFALKDGKCSPDCPHCNAYEFALNALLEKVERECKKS